MDRRVSALYRRESVERISEVSMIAILLITFFIFALAMLIMSVGVIFSGRCLRGSCGGPEVLDAAGQPISCAACPRRKKREAERSEESLPVLQS